jgi:SAM-dependent methyltransferase
LTGELLVSPGFEDQWRARFKEFAELRDDEAGIAGWTATGLDARVRRFLGLWKPGGRGSLWLDAGCGAGTYTRIVLQHGQRAIGVDYSLPTLRKAVDRNLEGATFAVADVRRLPFRHEEFDGVLCFGVTQALADSEPAVRELAKLVKTGGQLWIDALNGWCVIHAIAEIRRRILRRPSHLRYESPRRIRRLFNLCGFADVQLHWMPIMPSRSYRLQKLIESRPIAWIFRRIPLVGLIGSHGFIVHATRPMRTLPRET